LDKNENIICIYDLHLSAWLSLPKWNQEPEYVTHLRVVNNGLWGFTNGTSPHYLFQISTELIQQYSGHEYEIIGEVSDMDFASHNSVNILREEFLLELALDKEYPKVLKQTPHNLPDLIPQPRPWWNCEHIISVQSGTLVARCNSSPANKTLGMTQIAFIPRSNNQDSILLASIQQMNIAWFSATSRALFAILVDEASHFHLYYCHSFWS
jgi:hypothetical protein